MTTTIHEELKLPDEVVAAARRQALKDGKPLRAVISEWVVQAAERIIDGSKTDQPSKGKRD